MKRKRGILIFVLIAMVVTLALGVYAYYEYYGQYSALIHINGVIRLDAFDALDDDHRHSSDGYGTTPENPFIINNDVRMNNLIVLNNTGRLQAAKNVFGAEKFYFAFNFKGEEDTVPQVLDQTGIVQQPVGSNDYPFVDDLTGLMYAYTINGDEYIYLSAGATYTIEPQGGNNVNISFQENAPVFATLTAGTAIAGNYVKVPEFYKNLISSGDYIEMSNGDMYIKVDSGPMVEVPQIIANVTIQAPDDQLDIGFISHIGREYGLDQNGQIDINNIVARSHVHDLILYNVTIEVTESEQGTIRNALDTIWNSILEKIPGHIFAKNDKTDEKHIGLFAGHIDGYAKNITVAGEGIINIKAKQVNTYSRFTTVGFIDVDAIINDITFSNLAEEGEGQTLISGTYFADSIYELRTDIPSEYTYQLKDITQTSSGKWAGVEGDPGGKYFKQGIFRFALSEDNDTISAIWEERSPIQLLNEQGYNARTSVLYASDEYRYSPTQQGGGSIVTGGASANETRYEGISPLTASGNILDKGKYVITAHVNNRYYALKIVADIAQDGSIYHLFDNSEKIDVTDYIEDRASSVYTSAIWETDQDSDTPTFQNARFRPEYLKIDETTLAISADAQQAESFRYSITEQTFTFTRTEQSGAGYVSTKYYLTFDPLEMKFSFTTQKPENVPIEIFQISNGYMLELVTDMTQLTAHDDYVIVAKAGNYNYLLGAGTSEGPGGIAVVDGSFAHDLSFGTMPEKWNIQEYQNYKRYVWYTTSASNGIATFREKLSATLYLSSLGNELALSQQDTSWVYTLNQNYGTGGTLATSGRYLNYGLAQNNTYFSLAQSSYNIYLYKLIPDDAEPDYNTYQGANLVTSDSSIVQEGQYLIAVNYNGTYYGVRMSNQNTVTSINMTKYIDGTATPAEMRTLLDDGTNRDYKWIADTTTANPVFKNGYYDRYLSRTGNSLSPTQSSDVAWMYDAVAGRFYYKTMDNGVEKTYYLAYNTASSPGAFVITDQLGITSYIYEIRLYKVIYEYTYTGMRQVSSITWQDSYYISYNNALQTRNLYNSNAKTYFFLTAPLNNMANVSPYIIGTYFSHADDEGPVTSMNIAQTSEYNSSSNVFTTTSDLSNFSWVLHTKMTTNSGASNPSAWAQGYNFVNLKMDMYLAASKDAQSRTLVVRRKHNIRNRTSGTGLELTYSTNAATGFGFGTPFSSVSGNKMYIMGAAAGYEYDLWKSPTPGVMEIARRNYEPPEYTLPYLYQADGFTVSVLIDEMNEAGDNLDDDTHYMITAIVEDGDDISYYALGEKKDENGAPYLTGTDVTSQAVTINNSNIYDDNNQIIEKSSTDMLIMVPLESDWYQTSSEKNLHFYQDYYSTPALKHYLSVLSGTIAIDQIEEGTRQPDSWYYDSINKYFIYKQGSTLYYLAYDKNNDEFSLTVDIELASHVHIYRLKPTYVVSPVYDGSDANLKSGDFIVAARDANGYNAIGIDDVSGTPQISEKPVNDYIKEKLSETEYKEILNYIWKQQYYDFYDTEYNPSSSTQYMQLFSYLTGGGFTVIQQTTARGMSLGADPMVWKLTKNGVLWEFSNNRRNSDVTVGNRTITYNKDTSRLQIADASVDADYYVASGEVDTFSVDGYSIYLTDTNGNVITNPQDGQTYLLLVRNGTGANISAIKNSSGNISIIDYTGSTGNDNGCKFQAISTTGGWKFKNGDYQIFVDGDGNIITKDYALGTWTVNGSTGVVSYSGYIIPYNTSGSNISMTTNGSVYSARIYSYSSGTLTPVGPGSYTGSDRVIVLYDGTTYKAVTIAFGGFFTTTGTMGLVNLSVNSVGPDGVLTVSSVDSNALFVAEQYLQGYSFKRTGTGTLASSKTFYFNGTIQNGCSVAESQSTQWQIDSNGYLYHPTLDVTRYPKVLSALNSSYADGVTILFFEYIQELDAYFPVSDITDISKTYIMVEYDNFAYYLIGYDGIHLSRSYIGTNLSGDWTSGISSNNYITTIEGSLGYYLVFGSRYLSVSESGVFLSGTNDVQWEYKYEGQYGSASRLYSVVSYVLSAGTGYLTVGSAGNVETTDSQTDVVLFTATLKQEGYTLNPHTSSSIPSSPNQNFDGYVIVIYHDGNYYALRQSYKAIVAYKLGPGVYEDSIIDDMVWTADANGFKMNVDGIDMYIRRNNRELYLRSASGATWTYTFNNVTNQFTATNNSNTTALNIFRVDKSSELDEVTDILSMLSGKAKVTGSVSLLESGDYLIVAEVDHQGDGIIDRYYSLSLNDIYTSHAMDITNVMKLYEENQNAFVTFFDASVWSNRGGEIDLILKSEGFKDSYYLTGAMGNYSNMVPRVSEVDEVNPPADLTPYTWKVFSFNEDNQQIYLLGYTDTSASEQGVTYYLYFDYPTLTFKLTSDYMTAVASQNKVSLYQLAQKSVVQPFFTSFIIDVHDDGHTILSYPVSLVESEEDLMMYTLTQGDNGITVSGEYLIGAVNENNYYTLTLSDINKLLAYVDTNPYYSGNFDILTDEYENEFYGISINSSYIWKQVNNPAISLNFENSAYAGSYILNNMSRFTYDIENRQLMVGSQYLTFSLSGGFSISDNPSDMPIYLYLLGESGMELPSDDGELSFTYYTTPLTTIGGSVDFSKFEFRKTHMPDLKRYGVGADGFIGSTAGWTLYGLDNIITQAETSVFLSSGVLTVEEDNVTDMIDEMIELEHYPLKGDSTQPITYYAPRGSVSFVIDEASKEIPVFVNVVVTTEFDTALEEEWLRYMALWKMTDLDTDTGLFVPSLTYSGSTGDKDDYAYTFLKNRMKPYAAVPLPNRYGSYESGASNVRVDGDEHYLTSYGEDYYIAHTYVINEPGVYYLGASYGSFAITYLSIDDGALTGESETSGMGSDKLFTIDFSYGAIDTDVQGWQSDFGAIGTIARVYPGSDSWVQSNIFPQFILGTKSNPENPNEQLYICVNRTGDKTDSSVNFYAYSNAKTGQNILYANDNTAFQRLTRKVDFRVFTTGLSTSVYDGLTSRVWKVKMTGPDTFTIYSEVDLFGKTVKYYLAANDSNRTFGQRLALNKPVLETSSNYEWTIDEQGYLISVDLISQYLVYNSGSFKFSSSAGAEGVRIFTNDPMPEQVLSVNADGEYLLMYYDSGDKIVDVDIDIDLN